MIAINFVKIFNVLPLLEFFSCPIVSMWTKNFFIKENIHFFDSKRLWVHHDNWEKYLTGKSEAYSEPSISSTMKLFVKMCNKKMPLTIFANTSISGVRLGSKYNFVTFTLIL